MKNFIMLATAAALAVILTGCAFRSSSAASKADTSEEDAEHRKTISGVIVDATMNTAVICAGDGKEYAFSFTDETDRSKVNGMLIGDTLIVTYTGQLGENGSTAQTKVLAIEQNPAEPQNETISSGSL